MPSVYSPRIEVNSTYTPRTAISFILREDGFFLLREDGSKFMREDSYDINSIYDPRTIPSASIYTNRPTI